MNQADEIRCPECKGVRFKKCPACGGAVNSFHDFRDYGPGGQIYGTRSDWRAVNGEPVQSIPERSLQPPHK